MDTTTIIYYGFHVLGFITVLGYILFFAPKYGFKLGKATALTALAYGSMYIWMLALKLIMTGSGGQNIVRAFVFLPLFTVAYAKALKLDVKKSLDLVAAAPCIVQAVSHIGCVWAGCCASWLRVDWGIYNDIAHAKLFPVQICESITAAIIAAMLIAMIVKDKYQGNSNTMPVMLILFGLTRFLWEFMRDNKKLFCSISELALWAIGMAIVGGVWLMMIKIKQNKTQSNTSEV